MKSKFLILVMLIVVSGILISFTGCASGAVSWRNEGRFGELSTLPIKDFDPLGLVFTDVEFLVSSKGQINGEVFTFYQLLREAQKLGADTIINIVIDKRTDSTTSGMTAYRREMWYGSALAIKYLDSITNSTEVVTNDPRESRTITNFVTENGRSYGF